MFAGCVEDENPVPTPSPAPTPTQAVTPAETPEPTATLSPSQPPVSDVDYINDGGAVRVGAFNIQVFGKSKASKPEVMEVLGRIIRTYDVVAIQGIRDESQTSLPALVDTVNSGNSQYDYVVGERLGRTTSKEQYAYIYNTQTIELTDTPHSPHTYPEPAGTDSFHREPYIASFEAIACNFDFILIMIHVDPDEATEEINALDNVVKYAQSTYPDEQEFIVMGDLNADCSYFDEDSSSTMSGNNYHWCIDNSVDTTTKSTDCTYDRIIITNPTASYFTGDSGVFRYDLEYGLTEDETTAVSDHYPAYAEFSCNGGTVSTSTSRSITVTPAPTPAPTETGLVAHWKLDETNGTTAYDSVGSHNGTLVGSSTWTARAPEGLNPMGAIGLHSTDGSDARYVDCGDGGDLDITGDRSVAAWFKIDDWNVEWGGLVTKGNGALGGYNLLRSKNDSVYGGHDDGVAFQVYGQTGTDITSQQVVRGEINVTDGKWHHAAGTYVCDYDDGSSLDVGLLSIYVDGVLDRDYVVKGGVTLTNDESVQINGMEGAFFTNSTIDDVRIYNKALSLEEIRAIMGEFTSTDPVMWEYTEWAVDNPSWSGNEYDIVATVIFSHTSSGSTHTTEMFYDGSNTWKFRFTGTKTGEWTFATTSSDPELNGLTGNVTVAPNPDPNARGFLTKQGNRYAIQVGNDGELEAFRLNVYMNGEDFPEFIHNLTSTEMINAYIADAKQYGFDTIFVHVCNNWFDFGSLGWDEHSSENPDPLTFAALENLIMIARNQGIHVQIWGWGDDRNDRLWTSTGAGGINGIPDRRIQRYIAARLGPVPGWTMGYGFDLHEWTTEDDLESWALYLHQHFGWQHMLWGRARYNDELDAKSYPYTNNNGQPFSYDDAVSNLDSDLNRPHFYGERFWYMRDGVWTMENTRRAIWHYTLAGGMGSWWGFYKYVPTSERPHPPYPNPEQLVTANQFWVGRFLLDMERANNLTDGYCLKSTTNKNYVFYKEETDSVQMNLSSMETALPAIAVDAKLDYAEINIGTLSTTSQTWNAPYVSDWAVAVGDFD